MAVALEAEEVIAAFDRKAEEAAAAAAGETLERGLLRRRRGRGGGVGRRRRQRRRRRGVADLAGRRDGGRGVRAMQAVLKAYLSDSPQLVDALPRRLRLARRRRRRRRHGWRRRLRRRLFVSNRRGRRGLAMRPGVWIRTVASPPRSVPRGFRRRRRLDRHGEGCQAAAVERELDRRGGSGAGSRGSARIGGASRRGCEGGAKAGETRAKGGGGPARSRAHLRHRAAGVAKEVEEAAPRARAGRMFKAKDAAELQAAMRTQGFGELPAPSISVNEESVMVITWRQEDEAGAIQRAGKAAQGLDGQAAQLWRRPGERQRSPSGPHLAQGRRHALPGVRAVTKLDFSAPA